MATELAFPFAALAVLFEMRRRALEEEEATYEPPTDPTIGLDLEKKVVSALVGVGATDQLAQAYALFEQRHPRDALEPDRQRALSIELVDRGYRAIGVEALEKALRQPGGWEDEDLRRRRFDSFMQDPAYAVEALAGPMGASEVGEAGLDDLARTIVPEIDDPPGEGPVYLVGLSPQGWGMPFRTRAVSAAVGTAHPHAHGNMLAGPFDRETARDLRLEAARCGQPTLAVPADALTLAAAAESVTEIHLSKKEARFVTAAGERAFAYDDVANAILARIETVETRRELTTETTVSPTAGIATRYSTELASVVDSRHVLEVHAGADSMRLRIDKPRPELFAYLGRRHESSLAANVALAAKDLARFGPAVRLSHAVTYLLSERSGPGARFPSAERYEEYALWFWTLGLESVRTRWQRCALGEWVVYASTRQRMTRSDCGPAKGGAPR
jgi:hypothetical protein